MSDAQDNSKGMGSLGQSELLSDDKRDRADARLISRAIRERWPIPSEGRDEVTKNLLRSASGKGRRAISAARTLARMDALNQADEHKDRFYERIDSDKPTDLIRHQGIEIVVPPLPSRINDSRN